MHTAGETRSTTVTAAAKQAVCPLSSAGRKRRKDFSLGLPHSKRQTRNLYTYLSKVQNIILRVAFRLYIALNVLYPPKTLKSVTLLEKNVIATHVNI